MNALRVKKDDLVEVIAGKDKGNRGKILFVFPKEGKVKVEKLNMVKKHQKPTQESRHGGIIDIENPLRVDNVKVVCPKCDKAVKVGRKRLEDGKRIRICKSCDEVLDAV